MKKSTTSEWTPERRAKQAAAIRRWKPWLASTGPTSVSGKTISSRNAAKPNSIRRQVLALAAEIKEVLRQVKKIKPTSRRLRSKA